MSNKETDIGKFTFCCGKDRRPQSETIRQQLLKLCGIRFKLNRQRFHIGGLHQRVSPVCVQILVSRHGPEEYRHFIYFIFLKLKAHKRTLLNRLQSGRRPGKW